MNLPDLKKLKRLAATCRKAGISHFKSTEFEFTLTEEAPVSPRSAKSLPNAVSVQGDVESEEPDEIDLLFWSSGVTSANPKEETGEAT